MGCSASKHQPNQNEKSLPPVPRSSSLQNSSAKANGGSPIRNAWKFGSRATVDKQYITCEQVKSSSKLKTVREENLTNEESRHKVCEHTDGFSHSERVSRKHASSGRSASFGSALEFRYEPTVSPSARGGSNGNDRLASKHVENNDVCTESRASSFRVSECMDGFTGLRLLLSPATTPSRSFASSARTRKFSKDPSSNSHYSLNQCTDYTMPVNKQGTKTRLANEQCTQAVEVMPSQLEGMGDSEEMVSPHFDPSILATFEKAIEAASSDGIWPSSDATSSSCSRVGCSSSETSSDAESLCGVSGGMQQFSAPRTGISDSLYKGEDDGIQYASTWAPRKKPSSEVNFLHIDACVRNKYLSRFDLKCPPGCEGKIVLYFTSLRAIRKTYEDCWTVRLILKGFGVQVDERDVWMHSSFRQELTNMVGASLVVPRLFVRGRYIGGVEDVRHLHEEGILRHLLDGLPAELKNKCTTCAGIRFIPCTSCRGSCKLISFREVSRCPDCNENGLMMCPLCY